MYRIDTDTHDSPVAGEVPSKSFKLFDEDLNLGRDAKNDCISSFVTFPNYDFDENVWILGGIFMDNLVVTFSFDEPRKIGFASLR